jgi:hypothetical protein
MKEKTEAAIKAEAEKILGKLIAEETAVVCVAVVMMHASVSNGGAHEANTIWDAARTFVEVGKKKLKVDMIEHLAKS